MPMKLRPTEIFSKAADSYGKAWALLKDLPSGQPGRAAALAGQARTTALSQSKGPSDGIAVLAAAGYDPASIKTDITNDHDAADILSQGAVLLENAGRQKEAANAYRVSTTLRNLHDAEDFSGVGRTLWVNNGTPLPASLALHTGDAIRKAGGSDLSQAVYRYKQSYQLDPALAPAWNNLGVLYSQMGNPASTAYLKLSSAASPTYVLGNHNLAVAAYQSGIGNFFTAEDAQGAAIKAYGPASLRWGNSLSYDDRGPLPSPTGPPADFFLRVGGLVILVLLLLHTLVGKDRLTNRMGLVPTKGLIGRLAATVDARVKAAVPGIAEPQSGGARPTDGGGYTRYRGHDSFSVVCWTWLPGSGTRILAGGPLAGTARIRRERSGAAMDGKAGRCRYNAPPMADRGPSRHPQYSVWLYVWLAERNAPDDGGHIIAGRNRNCQEGTHRRRDRSSV